MEIRRLKDLCLQVLCSNASAVIDVGEAPFHLIRPLLARLTAEQLQAVEQRSPHIAIESDELWRGLCLRDFSRLADRYGRNETSLPLQILWREVYKAEKTSEGRQLLAARANLKRRFDELEAEKRSNTVVFVNETLGTKRRSVGVPRSLTLVEKARATSRHIASLKAPVNRAVPTREHRSAIQPAKVAFSSLESAHQRRATVPTDRMNDASLPKVTRQIVTRRVPSLPLERGRPP